MNLKWLWNGWCCAALWFAWPLLLATALVNSSYGAKMEREQQYLMAASSRMVAVDNEDDKSLIEAWYPIYRRNLAATRKDQ